MVAKYAGKRALLKDIARNKDLPVEERFKAQLELAALPRNSAETRIRNRCQVTGRPARLLSQNEDVKNCTS